MELGEPVRELDVPAPVEAPAEAEPDAEPEEAERPEKVPA